MNEIALREADETLYWLEILAEANVISPHLLEDLITESNELVAILVAMIRTAKKAKTE